MLGLKAISSFRDEKNSNLYDLLRHFPIIAEKFLSPEKSVFPCSPIGTETLQYCVLAYDNATE
jgi:hypothetical protein